MAELFEDWEEEKFKRYFPKSRRTKALEKGKKFVQLEGIEQNRFQDWLRKHHKSVKCFTADLAGHAESLAKVVHIHRAEGFTTPDLMIFEPQGIYHGIFMEFKTTEFKLYKRDGTIIKNRHIQDQYKTIMDLREKGYYADFVPGCARAQDIFTQYMTFGDVDCKFKIIK